jgi:hypothetical protein
MWKPKSTNLTTIKKITFIPLYNELFSIFFHDYRFVKLELGFYQLDLLLLLVQCLVKYGEFIVLQQKQKRIQK